ncbi:MAG: hypothetical protein V2I33_08950 [Kangiellaceae bacterium]|jgi:hypothetical protein|nr:hypothetical protein [Kangiellaceae bacterium]
MKNLTLILLIITSIIFISSCDSNESLDRRSGTAEDDYIAEPLIDAVKQFSPALNASNAFLTAFKARNYDDIYDNLISDELKIQMSKQILITRLSSITTNIGEIKEYKDLQWSFINFEQDGKSLLGSVKIVEHNDILAKYIFVFDKSQGFDKIVAFSFKVKVGVAPAGVF